jgi:hypothetical protein
MSARFLEDEGRDNCKYSAHMQCCEVLYSLIFAKLPVVCRGQTGASPPTYGTHWHTNTKPHTHTPLHTGKSTGKIVTFSKKGLSSAELKINNIAGTGSC